jgi:hypothetical protein
MSNIEFEGEDQGNDDAALQAIEHQARVQGWRPLEEFKGNPKLWVDAETFVEKGREIKQFTKRENDELRRKLAEATARLEEQGKTIEEIREYHAGMEKRAIEAAITRLKQEKRSALAEGNVALAGELDEEIDSLKSAPSAVPQKKEESKQEATQQEVHPAVVAWQRENSSWLNNPDEEDLNAYAQGLSVRLGNRRDLSVEDRIEAMNEGLRKVFPEKFGVGSARKTAVTAGSGEGGGASGSRKSNKSVAALPADARAAGERFVKQKLYPDLEAYAKEYFAQIRS